MATLAIIETSQDDFDQRWRAIVEKLSLAGNLLDDCQRLKQVREIVEKVRMQGDKAIAELTARYDHVQLRPEQFAITAEELQEAHRQMDPTLLKAFQASIENVRSYQQAIKLQNQPDWTKAGVTLGLKYTPLQRVGICIPGASAPLASTVIMTVVPAQVAGVKEIAIISSPSYNSSIHPTILGLCYELGISEVYRLSGAQGVAALAFGTGVMKKVDKIVGPGNWWGQLAKKEVFGMVDIDSFAGPSEVLIIADDSANPAWLAADMLSQAEHAPGSAILLTHSKSLAQATAEQIEKQLEKLSRSQETKQCIKQFSIAIVTNDLAESISLANDFAAEHLQIQCADSNDVANKIINAGAIFIGHNTPVATGDYYAGPSHTLPTGSSAKFFSALCVNDFLKQSSIISYNAQALHNATDDIAAIANAEGLDAHANSVKIRTKTTTNNTG